MYCSDCGSPARPHGSDWKKGRGKIPKWKCVDRECGRKMYVPRPSTTEKLVTTAPVKAAKRYVITSAQNATSVNAQFLASLQRYCKVNKAELLIIPFRYRNPTRPNEADGDDIWWDASIMPYLVDARTMLAPGLLLMGDIKIQPTATDPLSGLDTITGPHSGIFAHTKIALNCIPTPGHVLPKLLLTTGAVTRKNYSDTKAGKKGEFHHVFGAVVAEVDSEDPAIFHLRHINANSAGIFIDLTKEYFPTKHRAARRAAAVIAGDVHAEMADPAVLAATFDGRHSIVGQLNPLRVIMHDVLNFGSAGHHNDYFEKFRRHCAGTNRVDAELRTTFALLDKINSARARTEMVVVSSNHHDHFVKWLENHHNAQDIANSRIYHETKAAMLGSIEDTGRCINPFEFWARRVMKTKAKFLCAGESYQVHGIELGYHGDKGANGSRGSARGFDKIGTKSVIGHSHTPCIYGGVYQTGTTSLLKMGYNDAAPSSWLHSHVVIYGNGKRTHIHVINGSWRRKA